MAEGGKRTVEDKGDFRKHAECTVGTEKVPKHIQQEDQLEKAHYLAVRLAVGPSLVESLVEAQLIGAENLPVQFAAAAGLTDRRNQFIAACVVVWASESSRPLGHKGLIGREKRLVAGLHYFSLQRFVHGRAKEVFGRQIIVADDVSAGKDGLQRPSSIHFIERPRWNDLARPIRRKSAEVDEDKRQLDQAGLGARKPVRESLGDNRTIDGDDPVDLRFGMRDMRGRELRGS